jgi:hypothetical protein
LAGLDRTGLNWTGLTVVYFGWRTEPELDLGNRADHPAPRPSLFLRTLNSPSLNAPLLTSCLIALHHGVDQH